MGIGIFEKRKAKNSAYQNLTKISYNFYFTISTGSAIIVSSKRYIFNEEDFTMAYKITDACIACGACAPECPVEAIAEGEGIFVIDADKCIDCGACADACPVDAPVEG
jgi:ferredoxin